MAKRKKEPEARLPYTSEILTFSEQRGLNMAETMLLVVLRSCMNEKEKKFTCWPGQTKLAKKMRCSRATVQRAIASLASDKKKIISIGKRPVRKGGLENNVYSFLFSPQDINSDTLKLSSQRGYAKHQRDAIPSIRGRLSQASERCSSRTMNKNNVKKQSSTVKTVDDISTTSRKDTMDEEPEDKNMKYGFELEDEYYREMNIFDWYDYTCQKFEYLRPQVEDYIKNKGSGRINDPDAFHTSVLKRIRSGVEEGFTYVSPEEVQAEMKRLEEERQATIARSREQIRLRTIRVKKYGEANKLFKLLPLEDMEEIGLSMDSFPNEAKRKDFLISMIPEMKEMLTKIIY
jgi:hypothetical protein